MTPAKYFLDDVREAPEGWVPVRDPRSMLVIVRLAVEGDIEAISFDHDLGVFDPDGKELTGYWVLSRIEELVAASSWYRLVVPDDLRVHSANPAIQKKMNQAIEAIRRLKNDSR